MAQASPCPARKNLATTFTSTFCIMAALVISSDRMEAMTQVAERMNCGLFKQMPAGTAVRLGGRLSAAADGNAQLTTTDGGVVSVAGLAGQSLSGFVEVVGTKVSDATVDAAGVTGLGENVDAELWEEAMKMARLPQLRSLFEPTAMAVC